MSGDQCAILHWKRSNFVPQESDSESDSEQSSTTRIDDPKHIDDLDAEIIASGYNPDITLGEMVDSLFKSVNEDKSLPEPGLSLGKYEVITEENIAVYTGNELPFRFDIEVLFNFSDSYWVTELESQAESGLGNEVELCSMPVLDKNSQEVIHRTSRVDWIVVTKWPKGVI
ncbi:hypothetical protein BC629DRAFT_1437466 [Irpex lacteus]|nr:hypothetical protein BC629DRAFT_1437466 [Irpex lacteus]